MHSQRRLLLTAFLAVAMVSGLPASAAEPERPNIVFFYADDLGYGDLGCYGSTAARTPHLDRLAREGTRFLQFSVSHCVCSPTRASAITGHYPSRHRIYDYVAYLEANRRRGMPHWLDVEAPSLPRMLQRAGYRTAMIGKWHLGGGSGRSFRGKAINHPDAPPVTAYGFDRARTTFGNSPTWKQAEPCPEPHEVYPYEDEGWQRWSSRAIAEETLAFLEKHVRDHPERPFYVNVWFKDPHVPMRPAEAMRRPFRELDEPAQTHYAMIHFMDAQIGRVLARLGELGLREETLVVFASDNGAARGRGGSNGPLRGWKHSLYEGGVRVPLIVRWPGHVPAGRVDETSVMNIVDFVPTFCRLAGAAMPSDFQPDGEDVTAALFGKPFSRRRPLFWHHPTAGKRSPALAIRDGDWKLLMDPDGSRLELYNLERDTGEKDSLADREKAVVGRLKDRLLAWYATLPHPDEPAR